MDSIDRDLRQAADQGAVPGVVALAMQGDRVVYQGAFGRRALPDGPAMSMDTVFRIASMTKAVTAVAAMQMVEQGRLSLDAPAGEVVPELKEPAVLEGFDEAGAPRTRPAKRPLTLRNLLTHTSGFAYDTWNGDIARYCRATGLPAPRTGLLASLQAPLTCDPGERWQYSISIDWAGRMVEAVSGIDLETYFQARIFGPLGMEDTSYEVRPHMLPRLATAYARKDGALQPVMMEPNPVREFFSGGGGLHSTATDYMSFLRMLMNGGTLGGAQVLRPETVTDMGRNHIGDLLVEKMVSFNAGSSNDVELFPGMKKKWGLSFLINTERGPNGRNAGSLAWAGLYNSYYWLDPRARVAGALFTQILPFGDPTVLGLFDSFERGVYTAAGAA